MPATERELLGRYLRDLVDAGRDLEMAGAQEFPMDSRRSAENRIRRLKERIVALYEMAKA